MSATVLVRIRHKRCGRVLGVVTDETTPAKVFWFGVCRKCDLPSPERVADVLVSSGRDGFPLTRGVSWADIRPRIAEAKSAGHPIDLLT